MLRSQAYQIPLRMGESQGKVALPRFPALFANKVGFNPVFGDMVAIGPDIIREDIGD